MKNKLEELAAEVMGWPAGEVRLDQDRFVVGDGGESASFEEVAAKIVTGEPVEALGSYDAAEQGHHDEGGDYNFYAYMMEVAVDPPTGRVDLVETVTVLDCGVIINPVAHQGQVDGGFIYGLGNAMMEELVFEEGRVTTLSLGEYKLPTQMDVPTSFRSVVLQTEVGPGPFGAKAAGELTNTGVGGALANAISDAVGVRINTSPITAERVYEALQARGG
jgi:carbon-monoxide dehydrogenase large subunit